MPEAAETRPIDAGTPAPIVPASPTKTDGTAAPVPPSENVPAPKPVVKSKAKRGHGGARKGAGRKTKADEDDQDVNPRISTLPQEEFLRECSKIKDWSAMRVYVYRAWPKVDATLAGRKNTNIYKWEHEQPDFDLLPALFGNGVYIVRVNDYNLPSKRTEFLRGKIVVDTTNNPPVLDLDELVLGHTENRSYELYLRQRNQHPDQIAMQNQTPADSGATKELAGTNKFLLQQLLQPKRNPFEEEGAKALFAGFGEVMKQAAAQNDPAKLITAMKELREMSGMGAAPAGNGFEMLQGVVTMFMPLLTTYLENSAAAARASEERQQQLFTLMLNQAKPTAPADPYAEFNKTVELVKQVRTLAGDGGAAEAIADPKMVLYQSLAENMPQLALAGLQLARSWGSPAALPAASTTVTPMGAAPPNPAAAATVNPSTVPPYPHQHARPAGGKQPVVVEQEPTTEQVIQFLLAQYRDHLVDIAGQVSRFMERGKDGVDYADTFVDLNGEQVYNQVAGVGAEALFGAFQRIPEAWQLFERQPDKLREFIEQFCNPEDWSDDDEPPAAPKPRPAPPTAPRPQPVPSRPPSPRPPIQSPETPPAAAEATAPPKVANFAPEADARPPDTAKAATGVSKRAQTAQNRAPQGKATT